MSNKDKTRDKLLGTMRKTKAGAKTTKMGGNSGLSTQAVTKKAGKPVESKAAEPAKKIQTASRQAAKTPQVSDPYRSARRVWPD